MHLDAIALPVCVVCPFFDSAWRLLLLAWSAIWLEIPGRCHAAVNRQLYTLGPCAAQRAVAPARSRATIGRIDSHRETRRHDH